MNNTDRPDIQQVEHVKRKLERKTIFVLLALFFIVFLPLIRDRYVTFDMIYTTTLSDVIPIIRVPVFYNTPILYLLAGAMLIYLGTVIVRLFILKDSLEQFKRIYHRFDLVSFVVYLITTYIIVNAFFFSFAVVEGASMEPTFHDGDNVVMQHWKNSYNRGDLVVIRTDYAESEYLIKRVIGLPGEFIEIEHGAVFIGGNILDESVYLETSVETQCSLGRQYCSFQLDDEQYLVLGDNRIDSMDSRHFGAVSIYDIYGTVSFRYRPLSELGRVN